MLRQLRVQPCTARARLRSLAPTRSRCSMEATTTSKNELEQYDTRWKGCWTAEGGLQKGQMWDAGKPSPLLSYLFSSGSLDAHGKRVLVPGCGRGYDVVAYAGAGASYALGLDLVPEAIAAAQEECGRLMQDTPDVASRAHFSVGNFFDYKDAGGLFDIGYDYTFLCALHPDMRTAWAAGWGRHLSPGATLVTLIYPVDPSREGTPGPPWPVTPELYQQLLVPAGFEQVRLEPMQPAWSHPQRVGREWLGVWRWKGADAGSNPAAGSKI